MIWGYTKHVVRHLPNLSVADRCAVEQAARQFEIDTADEQAAYRAVREAEIAAYLAATREETQCP